MVVKVNKVKRFIQLEIRLNGSFVRPISSQFKELSHQEPDLWLQIKLATLDDHKDSKLFIEHNLVVIEPKSEDQVRIIFAL